MVGCYATQPTGVVSLLVLCILFDHLDSLVHNVIDFEDDSLGSRYICWLSQRAVRVRVIRQTRWASFLISGWHLFGTKVYEVLCQGCVQLMGKLMAAVW